VHGWALLLAKEHCRDCDCSSFASSGTGLFLEASPKGETSQGGKPETGKRDIGAGVVLIISSFAWGLGSNSLLHRGTLYFLLRVK
jgi:hypothetical protein